MVSYGKSRTRSSGASKSNLGQQGSRAMFSAQALCPSYLQEPTQLKGLPGGRSQNDSKSHDTPLPESGRRTLA